MSQKIDDRAPDFRWESDGTIDDPVLKMDYVAHINPKLVHEAAKQ